MRPTQWFFVGLGLSVAMFLSVLATASPSSGDAVYIRTAKIELSSAEKTQVKNFIGNVFPGADTSGIQRFICTRKAGVRCMLSEERTKTTAAFVALGPQAVSGVVGVSGGNVKYVHDEPPVALTSGQTSSLGTWVQNVFAVDVANVKAVEVYRQGREGDTVRAKIAYMHTAAPAVFVQDWEDGHVEQWLGSVP